MIRAVILDFDGVVLDSVDIKTRAFARLFAEKGPHIVQQVVDYHLANGGVSRFRKFDHIYTNILGQPLSQNEALRLGQGFKSLVFDEIVRVRWVPGAQEFLSANCRRYALFVASGTPQDELERIVQLRQIDKIFKGIFGSPATKEDIIHCILSEHAFTNEEVVFVGDALTDFRAACAANINFVGIGAAKKNPFPPGTVVLPDLTELTSTLTRLRFQPSGGS
jgi:phosphoglycolate phosphatase-like HAD superfamily hydrolase